MAAGGATDGEHMTYFSFDALSKGGLDKPLKVFKSRAGGLSGSGALGILGSFETM